MSEDFFPTWPDPGPEDEAEPTAAPVWSGPPEDALPGVVPVELVLGRSDSAVVALTGIRAWPTGVGMRLHVAVRGPVRRGDLSAEVFDGPYGHEMTAEWQASRLRWGFELADGRRVTNVDLPAFPHPESDDPDWLPDAPLLSGGGGSGGERTSERDYWLWPLPPPGPLRVVCEWRDQGIALTDALLDATPFHEAAARSRPLWD